MRFYQELINELQGEFEITELYLAYEINCRFECEADDKMLDQLYQAYIDNNRFNNIIEFVDAIEEWCEKTGFDFGVATYELILEEIY